MTETSKPDAGAVSRRSLLAAGAGGLSALLAGPAFALQGTGERFSREGVVALARALAARAYVPPAPMPEALSTLGYDAYRAIRYKREAAVWGRSPTRFSIEMFAPGSVYANGVDIQIVENGVARPVPANADAFETPSEEVAQLLSRVGQLAGFRLHFPLNRPEIADEFVVFQGASYFRAVSRGQHYGLSARGLAIDTAEPTGEEFPIFRTFWIERPSAGVDSIVVHGLLDSRRVTGAYRFGIYPGAPTQMEISATLFPRERLSHVGLGCLTSMYMHGPIDPPAQPDYRPAVHDSLGLAMETGRGERLWRPLSNPRALQMSAFSDRSPSGFGLVQRTRDFGAYQDLEARYETRPSAWVRPRGDWGDGHVQLVEIPSSHEGNDNIVAYWRPREGLPANAAFEFAYDLSWPNQVSLPGRLGEVTRSAVGRTLDRGLPQMVIDYANPRRIAADQVRIEASAGRDLPVQYTVAENARTGGLRVYLTFEPRDAQTVELRVRPFAGEDPIGETWLYRWTPRG
ncbi:glucan biosynthesis protein G [Marinicauda sp. Alg238-R41]|uniref:glucan biosynthesis protein G n=1 Tax=Marinicauda sp. Alg238-R41 TaxID=2993447 RepID=UPI0022E6CF71|nr:glucan biosynthesis protein G [Marinicauda sp. Alg238-R41]